MIRLKHASFVPVLLLAILITLFSADRAAGHRFAVPQSTMQFRESDLSFVATSIGIPVAGQPESGPIALSHIPGTGLAGRLDQASGEGYLYAAVRLDFPFLGARGLVPLQAPSVGQFFISEADDALFWLAMTYVPGAPGLEPEVPDLPPMLIVQLYKIMARVGSGESMADLLTAPAGSTLEAELVQLTAEEFNRLLQPRLETMLEGAYEDLTTVDPCAPERHTELLQRIAHEYARSPQTEMVLYFPAAPGGDRFRNAEVSGEIDFLLGTQLYLPSVLVVPGNDRRQPGAPLAAAGEDPLNVVHFVAVDDELDICEPHAAFELSPDRIYVDSTPRPPKPEEPSSPGVGLIHPDLEKIAAEQPELIVEVIVTLEEDLEIPRFPKLPPHVRRESAEGQQIIEERRGVMEELGRQRLLAQRPVLAEIADNGVDLLVREQFQIVNAFVAEVRAGDVPQLAAVDEVIFVRLNRNASTSSSHDGNPDNDNADGRTAINSDVYFDKTWLFKSGSYGIVDTGIFAEHLLFDEQFSQGMIFSWDCVHGGMYCDDDLSPDWDPDDCNGHGTALAAIVGANDALGDAFRGISPHREGENSYYLNVFKSSNDCTQQHDNGNIIRGIETSIIDADDVLVLALGNDGDPTRDDVAQAADNAFDAGLIVVAAAGNDGSEGPGSIDSPANAHKVIAVGSYDIEDASRTVLPGSSRGPTPDGRIKPDITAPSNTETAGIAGVDDLQVFNGTSNATPFAAGAAMLIHNFLTHFDSEDPGQTYAMLINAASRVGPVENDEGSGPFRLRACGGFWWGKIEVDEAGQVHDIPLNIRHPYNTGGLEAAAWWPEDAAEAHDDIDLLLYDPDFDEAAASEMAGSVFERLETPFLNLEKGEWTLRLYVHAIESGPQTVYWAVRAGGCATSLIP